MTAPECSRPSRTGTCIESLAAGWVNAPDLCGPCTRAFMTALDSISGPLKWHHGYTERAAMDRTADQRL